MQNELRLKIGQIEFEAKGDSATIERERIEFFNVLPQVVTAMSRTVYFQDSKASPQLSDSNYDDVNDPILVINKQMSINEFFNSKSFGNDVERTLGTAYYIEKHIGMEEFTSNDIKEYMKKAKLKVPTNVTQNLNNNAAKGFMQDVGKGDKGQTKYSMTNTGIKFVENYVPREDSEKTKVTKPRKAKSQPQSDYQHLTREELNIDNYPKVKDLEKFKDKMVLAMYIVTNENKGEYFTIDDMAFILTNIFGEKATYEQLRGVFRRETDWFNKIVDKDNKKIVKFKMLNGSIDFAKALIENFNI